MSKNELITIVLILLQWANTLQGNPIVVTETTEEIRIVEQLELLPAGNASFSLAAIQRQSFLPYASWEGQLQANEVYLGKLQLKNQEREKQHTSSWVIEFPMVLTDVFVYVQVDAGDWQELRTGQFVPVNQRTFSPNPKTNLVRIELAAGQEKAIYFRARCDRLKAKPKFNLMLYSADFYYENQKNNRFSQGLFIGFMLMMLIYNLFLYFFADRDKAYLNYSMYILGIVLYTAYNSGDLAYFTNSLFLPEYPKYSYLGKTSTYLVILGYLYFLRNFLNLKQRLPKWNQWLTIVLWINAIAFVVDVVLMLSTNFNADIADFVTVGNAIVFLLFIFSFGVFLMRVKIRNVNFIIAGIALMGLGSMFTIIARSKGVNYSTVAFEIGTIFEVIIFSLALASRRKRIEEEKQQAFFELQKTELLRAQEKKETQRLQELDLLKSQLYTNITHEVRTPLMIINGQLDFIAGFEQEKSIIKRNSNQLLRLINQVLDLSKMEANLLHVNLFQGDIVAFLQYITESFHAIAQAKNIELTFNSVEQKIMMDFDKDKIEHIVYNLIANALKFTSPSGKISLQLNKEKTVPQDILQLKVQDSGCGIAAEQLPFIFDRFHKLNNSDNIGTGIGLAFVKELVELLNGSIHVTSEVDQGTEVEVILPIRTEQPSMEVTWIKPVAEEMPILINEAAEEKAGAAKPLLLLIEDNRDVSDYIQKILHNKYNIQLAYDGAEGLAKALELVPDIIICDVMMPKMDGNAVTRSLKEDQKTSHIPIMMLTAKASQAAKNMGLQSGADFFLMKPFNKEELFIRLSNIDRQRKILIEKFQAGFFQDPKETAQAASLSLEDIFLHSVKDLLLARIEDAEFGVEDICQQLQLSKNQFYRKIKAITGESPTHFIRTIRLDKALQLLENTALNVSEIAYRVGFSDPNYFTRLFHRKYGKAPSQYAK